MSGYGLEIRGCLHSVQIQGPLEDNVFDAAYLIALSERFKY